MNMKNLTDMIWKDYHLHETAGLDKPTDDVVSLYKLTAINATAPYPVLTVKVKNLEIQDLALTHTQSNDLLTSLRLAKPFIDTDSGTGVIRLDPKVSNDILNTYGVLLSCAIFDEEKGKGIKGSLNETNIATPVFTPNKTIPFKIQPVYIIKALEIIIREFVASQISCSLDAKENSKAYKYSISNILLDRYVNSKGKDSLALQYFKPKAKRAGFKTVPKYIQYIKDIKERNLRTVVLANIALDELRDLSFTTDTAIQTARELILQITILLSDNSLRVDKDSLKKDHVSKK